MATTFKKNHRKSRPRLVKIEGRWEMFRTAFTHPELADAADVWCAEMNSLTRALSKRA